MGLSVLPSEEDAGDSVTAVLVSHGTEDEIRRRLREKFNIMVGGSLGKYGKGRLLRVGHMGLTASPEYVLPTLYALDQTVREVCKVDARNESMQAALEVFKTKPKEWGERPPS